MQQFIPFEDDWDALEQLRPEALVPYRVGLVPAHEPLASRTANSAATDAHWSAHAVVVAVAPAEKSA
ncbi:hypothetical protein ACFFJT_21090 [Dyella flava]|uniref:Uncharacterized protein n=1 Tax=Dyella flava TaxID=1920170 RepID=A0ABS2K0L4_9GAMM|nr:hypothetical protein [Dyella flava]MBM7123848.1 hypothetical protein [Dyella flava]GLQ52656.1 hypothetical protein GCM10010872_41050 [Dyella flava]